MIICIMNILLILLLFIIYVLGYILWKDNSELHLNLQGNDSHVILPTAESDYEDAIYSFNVDENGYNRSIDCSNSSTGILWVGANTTEGITNVTCVACINDTLSSVTWYMTNPENPLDSVLFGVDGVTKQIGLQYGYSLVVERMLASLDYDSKGWEERNPHDNVPHTISHYLYIWNATLLDTNFTCSLDGVNFSYQAFVVPSQLLN